MKDEYAKVGVPMLPVVRGEAETRRQILLYSVLLVAITSCRSRGRLFGGLYAAAAGLLGGVFLWLAVRLQRSAGPPLRAAPLPLLAALPRAAVRRDGGRRQALPTSRIARLMDRRLARKNIRSA